MDGCEIVELHLVSRYWSDAAKRDEKDAMC